MVIKHDTRETFDQRAISRIDWFVINPKCGGCEAPATKIRIVTFLDARTPACLTLCDSCQAQDVASVRAQHRAAPFMKDSQGT